MSFRPNGFFINFVYATVIDTEPIKRWNDPPRSLKVTIMMPIDRAYNRTCMRPLYNILIVVHSKPNHLPILDLEKIAIPDMTPNSLIIVSGISPEITYT